MVLKTYFDDKLHSREIFYFTYCNLFEIVLRIEWACFLIAYVRGHLEFIISRVLTNLRRTEFVKEILFHEFWNKTELEQILPNDTQVPIIQF